MKFRERAGDVSLVGDWQEYAAVTAEFLRHARPQFIRRMGFRTCEARVCNGVATYRAVRRDRRLSVIMVQRVRAE